MPKNKQGAKASDKCGVFTLGIQEKKKRVMTAILVGCIIL